MTVQRPGAAPRMRLALAALFLPLLACSARSGPATHDLLITGAKPDRLFVIDALTRTVSHEYRIPGADGWVGIIVPSPDGRIAYVLVNHMESIAGIELATGKQVFRADLSQPGERVKCLFSFDVTPDGRELIVYEMPTQLKPDEYVAEEPRFAIFATDAGLEAKAVRSFPAPRRVHMILARKDGNSFYALGFELFEYARADGKLLSQRGIRSWDEPGHSIPDLLAVWPVTEGTGTFVSPVYSYVTVPGGPAGGVPTTSLMSLDLTTGQLRYQDFEPTAALIFSTVASPVRKEAFGVYSTLTKIDTAKGRLEKRVDLAHTYYAVNLSSDGSEVYLGGAMCDVSFYDALTLAKKANLRLPDCPDQALATLRVVHP